MDRERLGALVWLCAMILVDSPLWFWRRRYWCHLVSDLSLDELHEFAHRLGIRRAWFQGDHYDITANKREHALLLGAVSVTSRELAQRRRRRE